MFILGTASAIHAKTPCTPCCGDCWCMWLSGCVVLCSCARACLSHTAPTAVPRACAQPPGSRVRVPTAIAPGDDAAAAAFIWLLLSMNSIFTRLCARTHGAAALRGRRAGMRADASALLVGRRNS